LTDKPETEGYLRLPPRSSGLVILTLSLAIYQGLGSPDTLVLASTVLLVGLAVCLAARAPRALVYGLLSVALALSTFKAVMIDANGPQDRSADRDEAVEIAAASLLRGANPWQERTALGSAITTGPSSILAATPFVWLFGRIDVMSLLFWIGLLACLLLGDLQKRNDSFTLLSLFYYLGIFELYRAQYWSLEELYHPLVMVAVAVAAQRRGRAGAVGAVIGIALLWRASYLFAVIAFLSWLAESRRPRSFWVNMAAGCLVTVTICLALVAARAGISSLGDYASTLSSVADQPAPGGSLAAVPMQLSGLIVSPPFGRVLLGTAALALTVAAVRYFRRYQLGHPYWHVAFAAWLAHSLVWYPLRAVDYSLMFILPALLAIAESDATHLGRTA
jgi:hypothetical protein